MATKNDSKKTSSKNDIKSKGNQNNYVYVNYFPEKLCRKRVSKSNNQFVSVSFLFKDAWASVALSPALLKASTNRNGETIPERFNLFLGDRYQYRNVSVSDGCGGYKTERMSNSDLSIFMRQFLEK